MGWNFAFGYFRSVDSSIRKTQTKLILNSRQIYLLNESTP